MFLATKIGNIIPKHLLAQRRYHIILMGKKSTNKIKFRIFFLKKDLSNLKEKSFRGIWVAQLSI